jgi:hypothetical protein|tara:strand:+ start:153 stop:335 length:183 start_codon:yes stop_codon:yes gene_type:complete
MMEKHEQTKALKLLSRAKSILFKSATYENDPSKALAHEIANFVSRIERNERERELNETQR